MTPGRPRPFDWWALDGSIMRETGITPAQLDEMTLPEILALLDRPEPAGQSEEDFLGAWRREQSLSPTQRLLAARRR